MAIQIKLVHSPKAVVEGDKRQHAPYLLEWSCSCGSTHVEDFTSRAYLSYPKFGKNTKYTLWCEHCDKEHAIKLRATLTLEAIDG